ncbi:MAG: PIG-L family deacetylase [Bacteroidota bacterium]
MHNIRFLLLILLSFCGLIANGQAPKKYLSSEIQQQLEKLNVLGSVLYVAAHPDDENTRMIAYFANEEKMRTAYLSATRGDGGQNLIGSEIREKLGVIRTQELLAARRTDGGRQFFSRANDFGYSKHPDETFNIWDKQKVLADFVWVIRKFRPDIMVTRFSEQPGVTHGHHTASAILAREAFKLAGDKNAFPEQLAYVSVWQPRKLFWNTSWWFFRNTRQKMDTAQFLQVDVGKYNPLLGLSYTEIASLSRSMHKSQGFGSTGSRGKEVEYLQQLEGPSSKNLWDGMNTTWLRVKNGEKVKFYVDKAINEFNPGKPHLIVPHLLGALGELENLEDRFWKKEKTREIKELIKACMGLYFEGKTPDYSYVPGDTFEVSYEVINRSKVNATLKNIYLDEIGTSDQLVNQKLENNRSFKSTKMISVPANFEFTNPYWLNENSSLGMYVVKDQQQRGKPENDPAVNIYYEMEIEGIAVTFSSPLIFKRNDPVDGEVYRPLEITPRVFVNIDADVLLFSSDQPKSVEVTVTSGKELQDGELTLDLPEGWKASPESYNFRLEKKGEEAKYNFSITPPKKQSRAQLFAVAKVEWETYRNSLSRITYDHIPVQGIYTPKPASLVRVNIEKRGNKIGYIMGAGDDIPESLRQIGYQVDLLGKDDATVDNMAQYDAVILGVRALNTVSWLKFKMDDLFSYTENGGNLIIQYNTNFRLVTDQVSPYPLTLSRDRVTVEEAEVRILAGNHAIMNYPNKITAADFDGWVQERGLYFPSEWDSRFTPILSSNDPGEPARNGGLLVAKHGKGNFIYTGYSWFRELPAGVAGAYRIFANMISLGKK